MQTRQRQSFITIRTEGAILPADLLQRIAEGEALGQGFLSHPSNGELRQKLRTGTLNTQDYYRQLLRLVYRLLFLFVAEDRELLLEPSSDAVAKERSPADPSVAHPLR
ncbi:hypothetical protein [Scytonema sp. NUACC26]|uniref:hypothetical protein n=1 Tax=Scytonema sp. NUACC26 TaxID=3140176 RepID=UPI0034DCC2AB